jgi:GNAT superfamily N-acetyltransferase
MTHAHSDFSYAIERLRAPISASDLDGLAAVLYDCVANGASVSFMHPYSVDKALVFWRKIAASVERDERILLAARDPHGSIIGTVQVITDLPENQPHRGDVAKMLVHSSARRRGLGEALMRAAEAHALAAGRTLLVLDTVTGSDAARLYTRLGWQRVGDVPDFALYPDGRPCATTYYYKQLA